MKTAVRLPVAWSLALLVSPTVGWSQDFAADRINAPQDILSAVPHDAWGLLCIPDVARFDSRIMAFMQQLNVPMMGSPVAMLQAMSGVAAGFDDAGALGVALMPVAEDSSIGQSIVLFIPTSDYAAMTALMSPEPIGDGVSRVYLMDDEAYIAQCGRFAVVTQRPELLTKVRTTRKTIESRLNEHQKKRLRGDDVMLWVDLKSVASSETMQKMLSLPQETQVDREMFGQLKSLQLGIRFDQSGLALGVYLDAAPESDTGQAMSAVKATTESTLAGLPGGPFVLAMGAVSSKLQSEKSARWADRLIGHALSGAGDAMAALGRLRPVIAKMMEQFRGVAVRVSALPPGPDGVGTVQVVIKTDGGSQFFRDSISKMIDVLKTDLAGNAEANELLEQVKHKPDAETIDGVVVDHLTVGFPADADPTWIQMVQKIVGKDGLTVRIAAVDKNRVAVSFGGGADSLRALIAAVRKGAAPLAEDAGLKRAADRVPKKRASEAYLAYDRAAALIRAISKITDQPFPIVVDPINVPIAMVSAPAGGAGSQTDIHLPIEVLIAIKNTVSSMMGGQMIGGVNRPGEL